MERDKKTLFAGDWMGKYRENFGERFAGKFFQFLQYLFGSLVVRRNSGFFVFGIFVFLYFLESAKKILFFSKFFRESVFFVLYPFLVCHFCF